MPTPDALQMLFKGDQIKPAARQEDGPRPRRRAGRRDRRAREGLGEGQSRTPRRRGTIRSSRLPSGKVFSPTGMMIWPRRQRDLSPRDLRQLSRRQGDPVQRVRGPATADGPRARGREPLFRQDPALEGGGGDDPLAVPLDGRTQQGRAPARRRRADEPEARSACIGAGFMGAGVAYVSASAGLEVVLIDRDQESADKGKAHSEKLISSQIAKGRAKSADRDALLARIHADRRLRGPEGLRPRGRGGVRGSRGEEGGDREGAGRGRRRRRLRQQHLDAADHLARRDVGRSRRISSASISSRRSTR